MGRWRLRGCSRRLRNGKFFSANRSARSARSDNGSEEHRSFDCGATAQAICFYHARTTGNNRPSHGRRDGLWVQVFGSYRLGDVAKHLLDEATASGQETSCYNGLDAGSFVRPRHRTGDHLARCPSFKRSAGSYSSANKTRIRSTNQFSNQRQEFITYG